MLCGMEDEQDRGSQGKGPRSHARPAPNRPPRRVSHQDATRRATMPLHSRSFDVPVSRVTTKRSLRSAYSLVGRLDRGPLRPTHHVEVHTTRSRSSQAQAHNARLRFTCHGIRSTLCNFVTPNTFYTRLIASPAPGTHRPPRSEQLRSHLSSLPRDGSTMQSLIDEVEPIVQ